MAKNLLLYDKYNKVINTTLDVKGTTGYITIENLIPDTDYPEGEFYVGWEVEGKILPKATVPEFTTLRQMREKLVIVYFSDLTEQQLVDIKGDSAYKVALDNGFNGSQKEWLESLKGEPGEPGRQGDPGRDGVDITEGGSAYEIALAEGFQGTREEWLESLKGEPGKPGEPGEKGDPGEDGFGVDGASAYEIALENGFVGNIQDFLDSLVGEPGRDGQDGNDGLSAYEIALENGFQGTEEDWLNSLKNTDVNKISDIEAEALFIAEMNKKVTQLGSTTSKFLNSHGLTELGQLCTAYDFNLFTLHASTYKEIANIWGQKNYTLKVLGNNSRDITMTTTVTSPSLENYYTIIGGKTGTMGIVRNLTAMIKDNNNYYIATIMRAQEDRFNDLKLALDEAIKKENGNPYNNSIGDSNTSFSIVKYPLISPSILTAVKPSILLSNKETTKQNPASMTKLVTSMVMLDNMTNMNQVITIQESDLVSGSGIPLQVGDKLTLRDSLYAMLLPSSNITAKAVARTIGHEIHKRRSI